MGPLLHSAGILCTQVCAPSTYVNFQDLERERIYDCWRLLEQFPKTENYTFTLSGFRALEKHYFYSVSLLLLLLERLSWSRWAPLGIIKRTVMRYLRSAILTFVVVATHLRILVRRRIYGILPLISYHTVICALLLLRNQKCGAKVVVTSHWITRNSCTLPDGTYWDEKGFI